VRAHNADLSFSWAARRAHARVATPPSFAKVRRGVVLSIFWVKSPKLPKVLWKHERWPEKGLILALVEYISKPTLKQPS